MSDYDYSGSNRRLSADEVSEKDAETQIDIMRDWFNYHFEDPNNQTPRLEGKYFYINGGPYDPYEVLGGEFDDIVPEDIIHILAKKLCITDWAPTSYGNYYRDNKVGSPIKEFNEIMKNIKILLSAKFDNISPDAVSSMHRLLYANIIIAIEVYLSDKFKKEITYDDSTIKYFVETASVFKEQKISISDIYKNMASIEDRVNNYHTMLLWHRLDKIKKLYENTFGIKFPKNIGKINKAIVVRHDIIHRNGKTKNGEYHKINETIVKDLIDEAREFIYHIDEAMIDKILYPTTE